VVTVDVVVRAGAAGTPRNGKPDERRPHAVHGSAVLQFTPDGRLDRRIDMPVTKPSMTAFGGSDMSTLFVTSIGGGGPRCSGRGWMTGDDHSSATMTSSTSTIRQPVREVSE